LTGRANSPHVAVVMTDGGSNNPASTANQASIAKDNGMIDIADKHLMV